jgi:hypothetical protein
VTQIEEVISAFQQAQEALLQAHQWYHAADVKLEEALESYVGVVGPEGPEMYRLKRTKQDAEESMAAIWTVKHNNECSINSLEWMN